MSTAQVDREFDWETGRALERKDAEIARLRGAIAAIQKATVEGRVCDDVAWFDTITTLYDFCDQTLNPPNRT